MEGMGPAPSDQTTRTSPAPLSILTKVAEKNAVPPGGRLDRGAILEMGGNPHKNKILKMVPFGVERGWMLDGGETSF